MLDSTFSPYSHPADMSAIVKSMFMSDIEAFRVDKAIDEDSRMIVTHGEIKSYA